MSSKTMIGVLPPSSAVTLANRDAVATAAGAAGLGAAGQGDLGDVGMAGEAFTRLPTAGHHGHHSRWKSCGIQDLDQREGGERGEFGGFDHHGVAGGQCRGQAPRKDQHRMVERGDDAADTERGAPLVGQVVAVAGQHGVALGGQQRRVVAEPFGHPGQLRPGLGDRPAVVAGLQLVQPLRIRPRSRRRRSAAAGPACCAAAAATAPESKAALAVCTAASTSAAVCSGTVPRSSPVAGLMISRIPGILPDPLEAG